LSEDYRGAFVKDTMMLMLNDTLTQDKPSSERARVAPRCDCDAMMSPAMAELFVEPEERVLRHEFDIIERSARRIRQPAPRAR